MVVEVAEPVVEVVAEAVAVEPEVIAEVAEPVVEAAAEVEAVAVGARGDG